MDELEVYQRKSNYKSVLVFPPLPSRLRYLIHKTTEELSELTSFSVGEICCRRVVVCYSQLRDEADEDSDLESNDGLCEEPSTVRRTIRGDAQPKPSVSLQSKAPRRPDKPLYMPRAARERLSLHNHVGPSGDAEFVNPASGNCISSSSGSCSCSTKCEGASCACAQDSLPSGGDCVFDHGEDSSPVCDSDPDSVNQTVTYLCAMTLEEDEEETLAHSPHSENTSGDTYDLTDEIRAHLKEAAAVSIEDVHNDYSTYEKVWMSSDEFGHVIEIHDFPPVFKTDDLLDAFREYSDGGMKITWVDNTHALGVFSSESAALHALSISHPLLKARALAEGTKKSKSKATRRAEFIQPVKERPKTDSAVARRMVTRALGLQRGGRGQRY